MLSRKAGFLPEKILGIPFYLFLLLLVFALPHLLRLFRPILAVLGFRKSEAAQDQENRDAARRDASNLGAQIPADRIYSDAKTLAHHLGTAYSVLDPRSWSEDEKAAVALLAPYDPRSARVLVEAYRREVSRDLPSDLNRYLTPEQWSTVRYLFL